MANFSLLVFLKVVNLGSQHSLSQIDCVNDRKHEDLRSHYPVLATIQEDDGQGYFLYPAGEKRRDGQGGGPYDEDATNDAKKESDVLEERSTQVRPKNDSKTD